MSLNRDCTVQNLKVKMGYQKGEVVLRDQPFAYVIKLDCRSKVCDYCVKSPKTGKPLKNCSACKIVYYCNANCQKSAWNSHHQGKISWTYFGRSVYPISTKEDRLCPPPLWQYGLLNFQAGYKKLERFLPKGTSINDVLTKFFGHL